MADNELRKIWLRGQAATNLWINIPSPVSAEFVGMQGWDTVTIDQQHGLIDYKDVLAILQALQSSSTIPIVRVAGNDASMIGKCLDAGAAGIICPLVDNEEQCAAFVKACRYPPKGGRSFGPIRSGRITGRTTQDADDYVVTLAMIETRAGLENLEAICATPGLDGVFVGPSDLSLALGFPPDSMPTEPAVLEAMDKILATAKSHNIAAGIFTGGPDYAEQMIEKGFNFVTVTSDIALLMSGVGVRKRFDS